jgi:hypothetical protein
MRRRLGARLPRRIAVPFLLFWCLGSLVLGHELASFPFASIATAVMRPLQATLQVQGMIPGSDSSGASHSQRQQDATQRLTVAALLGRKIPVVSRARAAKAGARSKVARRMSRDLSVSTRLAQRSAWGDPAETGYAPAFGAWQQMPVAVGYAPPWHAFSWDDGDGWNAHVSWESAGWNSPGALSTWRWMGPYTGE